MKKAKTFPETRRILGHLREAFRRAGHGSMVRTARSLGLHDTFFSEGGERRKRLDVGLLIRALQELQIPLTEFFAEAEGRRSDLPWQNPGIHEQSTEETRQAVRLAYRRMRAELPGVDLIPELENGDRIAASEPVDGRLGEEWLDALDSRRQDAPEAVAAEVASHLHQIEAGLLPRALGVWSSALRLTLDLEVAADLNSWALRLAQATGDSVTVADLYIRRGYIAADNGDYRQGLTLSQLAAGVAASLGDLEGEGRALVDCSRTLHYLGRSTEAIKAGKRALELLPESLADNRLTALCTLGSSYLAIGDPIAADELLSSAAPLADSTGKQDQAKVLWLRASVCRQQGQRQKAERLLRYVVDIFRGLHFGEAALAGVELVRVLLEQGKPGEAQQVCNSLLPLLDPLEQNPIVEAAFGELLRAGARGSLCLALTRQIKASIEGERTKASRQWRALAVTA